MDLRPIHTHWQIYASRCPILWCSTWSPRKIRHRPPDSHPQNSCFTNSTERMILTRSFPIGNPKSREFFENVWRKKRSSVERNLALPVFERTKNDERVVTGDPAENHMITWSNCFSSSIGWFMKIDRVVLFIIYYSGGHYIACHVERVIFIMPKLF